MEGRSGGRVALPPMQHAVQEARDLPLGALGTASRTHKRINPAGGWRAKETIVGYVGR
ncbi:unnamed protein product, partial [Ectocarpus fasciculatus]